MHHRAVSKCKNCFASKPNQIARCSPGTHPRAPPAYGCAIPGARSELPQHSCCTHAMKRTGRRFQLLWGWWMGFQQVAETPSTYSQVEISGDHSPNLVRVKFHSSFFLKAWDKENALISYMCITVLWNTSLAGSQLTPVILKTFSPHLSSSCILGYKRGFQNEGMGAKFFCLEATG